MVGAFPITKSQPEITSAAKLGPSTAPPRGSWVGGVSPEGSFLKPLLSAPSVAILARYASTCHKTLRWTLHSMYIICLMDGASQLSVLLVLPWRWPSCCWLCLAAASVCVSVCLCVSVRRVLRSPAYLERFPLGVATVEEALRNWTSERVSELHFFAEGQSTRSSVPSELNFRTGLLKCFGTELLLSMSAKKSRGIIEGVT